MPEPAVVQAPLGRAGSGTPAKQSSEGGKGQLHCRTWRGLHQHGSRKGLSDEAARKDASCLSKGPE